MENAFLYFFRLGPYHYILKTIGLGSFKEIAKKIYETECVFTVILQELPSIDFLLLLLSRRSSSEVA